MNIGTLQGTIDRRLLLNYRVDPDTIQRLLPPIFEPLTVDGYAMAGICLIDLRLRPTWAPKRVAWKAFAGAHRIAVRRVGATSGPEAEAVYIPRRDSTSRLYVAAGGRIFGGPHHLADVDSTDDGDHISIALRSRDDETRVGAEVAVAAELAGSVFATTDEASAFYERGSLGYSDAWRPGAYDAIELRTTNWVVTPLRVSHVDSTFFDDDVAFPPGTATFDNALLMRDIDHSWHMREPVGAA